MAVIVMRIIFMNNRKGMIASLLFAVQVLLISNLVFPGTAYAYVDPGSGGVIVTTILGFIAAIGYTFRKYFYKIKRMFTGKKAEDEQKESE